MGRRAAAAVFLLLCLCSNAQGKLRRFGAASKTLHVSHSGAYQEWDEKFVVIQADADFQETDEVQELLKRYRRDTKPADNVRSTVAPLNDTHTMLIVHWAGDNSNVIIALAKSAGIHGSPNSSVFVSRDYGASFTSITDQFAGASSIDKYFNSDLLNSHYVFTDVNRRCIFTTRDYARNIVSKCNLPFKPAVVSLSPSNADHILAFDPGSFFPDLYLSTDFGQSWRVIRHNVKAFFWGVDPYDAPNTLYVEEKRGYGGNIVLRSSTYFSDNLENVVIQGVEDFEVREEYMFATKKVHLFGSLQSSTYQFWVSYNRSEFINAMFPGRADNHTDYFVADASEDQVMVCVTHGNLNTSLYISDVLGSRFSLSLENIVYFSPTGANSDTWLSFYASESFADIHKVAGLRGIYIASQLVQDKKLSVENQRSLITYDKGGQWELLNAPTDRQLVNCTKQKDVLHFWNKDQARNCSLHVSQEFQRLYPGSLAQPLLSRESAPGILIASGSVGSSLLSEMNIFVSSDAGYSWHQVLDGSYLYAMADHGGILVAVQQFQPTDTIYYSVNEGQTWAQHKFVNNSIRVYGLLTEPGERTTIFSLFGSYTGAHSWILVQINMSAVLGSPCRKEDYKNWTLSENNPDAGCLLGRKVVYRRRIAHAVCYNGEDFVRFKELQNCLCTRNDFECDYGWRVDQNSKTSECVPDAEAGKVDGVPYPCPPGTYYQHSRGYRRVPGDTCTGGNETLYAPVQYSCPVQERSEFLLAAQRGQILAVDLDSFTVTTIFTLPAGQIGYISAVAFDYQNNTVYWGMYEPAKIESLNLNISSTREVTTVTQGHMQQISSLAFDWTSAHLYWTDQEKGTIEVVSTNGLFRRNLISSNSLVRRPAHLVVDPPHGQMYWLELTVGRQSLMRAWMDGTHIEVFGPHPLLNMPQGLTLDLSTERLYWTQGVDNHVRSINLAGTDVQDLVAPAMSLHSPGPVSTYKNSLYWVNNRDRNLVIAGKHSGVAWFQMTFNYTVVDMKTVSHTSQQAQSACSPGHPRCSQLCLPKPHATDSTKVNRTCLCGDGFQTLQRQNSSDQQCVCGSNERMTIHGDCEVTNSTSTCRADQFKCNNQRCIPSHWKCDREDDCGDTSDELDCPFYECPNGTFKCANGRCIPSRWHCDFDNDCRDEEGGTGSDERNCSRPNCTPGQFRCANQRCIPEAWKCDFDNDCHDNSDEMNCTNKTCQIWEHICGNGRCISPSSVCNGINDCSDNSDERNCSTTCNTMQFKCANGSRCIYKSWRCDGDVDCADGSDEKNCNTTTTTPVTTVPPFNASCLSNQFRCEMGFCIDDSLICDGADDCGDASDERSCDYEHSTTMRPCKQGQYPCDSGQCISQGQRCDGQIQCIDGSDERLCDDINTCASDQFRCNTTSTEQRHCIWDSWLCDGERDCPFGEDEEGCIDVLPCNSNAFQCVESGECISISQRCNGVNECDDMSDEKGCLSNQCEQLTVSKEECCAAGCAYLTCDADRVYGCFNKTRTFGNTCSVSQSSCSQVPSGGATVNVTYFYKCPFIDRSVHMMLLCDTLKGCSDCPGLKSNVSLSVIRTTNISAQIMWQGGDAGDDFMVSYIETSAPTVWQNVSTTNKYFYTLSGLKPYTSYTLAVYIKRGNSVLYPSDALEFWTDVGKPSQPRFLEAYLLDETSLQLTWQPPKQPNGENIQYRVTVQDLTTGIIWKKQLDKITVVTEVSFSHTYSITLQAMNTMYTSDEVHLNFTYNKNSAPSLAAEEVKDTSVKLIWNSFDHAERYIVTANLLYQDRQIQKITQNTSFIFDGLCPGTSVTFSVKAESGDHRSLPSNLVNLTTKGNTPAVVGNLSVVQFGGGAQLRFVQPKNAAEVDYVVYYDSSSDLSSSDFLEHAEKLEKLQVPKGRNNVTVGNLRACSWYRFRIGTTSNTCPFSSELVLRTKEDNKTAPRGFKTEILNHDYTLTVNLTWDAPCDSMSSAMSYKVTVMCSTCKNKPLTTKEQNLEFKQVKRGMKYSFILQTDVLGSETVEKTVSIPPYPAPVNIEVRELRNSSVHITWQPNKDQPSGEDFKGYNLTIQHVDTIVTSVVTSVVIQQSSYMFDAIPGFLYNLTLHVVVKDAPPGETDHHLFSGYQPTASNVVGTITLSKTNFVAILVPIGIVVVGLMVLVMVFVVRHRRLQRSFLAFANSHYNTRSETTRFGNELDDGDEPLIQGFSDDEPLVLA